MITYEIVPMHTIVNYLQHMAPIHHEDIKDKSMYPSIHIDWDSYIELSEEGLCHVALARDDGEIIGYQAYVINTDLNKGNEVIATSMVLYIEPEYRGRLIVEFIKNCDKMLIDLNVKQVLHNYSDVRIGEILKKAGYKPKSITSSKTL